MPESAVKNIDGYDGVNTWKAVQAYRNSIGYHLVIDGIEGFNTWKGLQIVLGTPVEGIKSKPSHMIMAIQKALNSGKN